MSSDNYGMIVKKDGKWYGGDWSAAWVDRLTMDELHEAVIKDLDGVSSLTHVPDATSDEDVENWIMKQGYIEYGCLFVDLDEKTEVIRKFTDEYDQRLTIFTETLVEAMRAVFLSDGEIDDQVDLLVSRGIPRDALFLCVESAASLGNTYKMDSDKVNTIIHGIVVGMLTASKYKDKHKEGSE